MSEATTKPAPAYERSHREILIVFSGLMLAMFLAALDQTVVSTALTTIVSDLKGSTHLSWVVTAYLLTSTAATPLYGKIGDLYGRKKIFLFAITLFLIGSALCGAAQNMDELIGFRALQGVGAGGLFSLSLAIVGDIVPPADRGRYQGLFGAIFGLSSVIGPLIGGVFTEHASWRWVFYVNLPVGLIALVVVSSVLHLPKFRTEHRIDFLGAFALTASVTTLLLASVWGGGHPSKTIQTPQGSFTSPFTGYAWGSGMIIGLIVAAVVLLGLFLWQENRHAEPILPLVLFKDRIFSVSVALSFLAGGAMFGAIIFLPQFQQIVRGYSPTKSGLLMIPMTIGVVAGAVGSGRLISKLGRYRMFPIVGTAITTLGFVLMSLITISISQVVLSVYMFIVGLGIGLFMQVTTLAVQNSVDFKYMGAATSATTFFRTLGGSFGTAIFGSILNNRLRFTLPQYLSQDQIARVNLDQLQHSLIVRYGSEISTGVFHAYSKAVHVVFLWAVPVMVIAFLLSLALPDKALRGHGNTAAAKGESGEGAMTPVFE
jgi:EmrB/QacA subfamily drug resistance transporter